MDGKLKQPYQGSLIKFTNVVKGWQTRWFIIDPERGVFEYYLSQGDSHEKARGSISLAGAVISPSDEDSQTFSVSPTVGESYKLRAHDTKNRQMWINRLRVVAEMHTRAIAHQHTPLVSRDFRSRDAQPQGSINTATGLDVIDAFTQVAEVLELTQRQHSILSQSIEELPSNGSGVRCIDPNLLLIKASSQATLLCLDQCLAALRSRHFALKYSAGNQLQVPSQPAVPSNKALLSLSPRLSPNLDHHRPSRYDDSSRFGSTEKRHHRRWSSSLFLPNRTRSNISHQRSSSFMKPRKRSHSPLLLLKSSVVPSPTTSESKEISHEHLFEKCSIGSSSTLPPETPSKLDSTEDAADFPQNTGATKDDLEVSDSEEDATYLQENEDSPVEDGQKSVIMHIISQLRLGMDLTRVTLPTFILEKRSLLEMFADFLGHPDYFLRIGTQECARDRIMAVVRWYLTSIHVGRRGSTAKKPFNPIIGEVFNCSWRVPASLVNDKNNSAMNGGSHSKYYTIKFTSEQVSHHPPVSAFYFECPEMEMCINAHIWTKSKFMGMSVGVNLVGSIILFLGRYSEVYHLGMPSAYARSVLTEPWVELGGRVNILCPQSGYSSPIVFHTKPFYGGKLHKVTCEVKNANGNAVCRVQGEWDSFYELSYEEERTETIQIRDLPLACRKRVRPVELQMANESRCLWFDVCRALALGSLDTATNHKKALEDQQRADEQQRAAAGVPFPTKRFTLQSDIWVYKDLPKYARKLLLPGD